MLHRSSLFAAMLAVTLGSATAQTAEVSFAQLRVVTSFARPGMAGRTSEHFLPNHDSLHVEHYTDMSRSTGF